MCEEEFFIKRELNEKGEIILTFIFDGLLSTVKEINSLKVGKCFRYFPTNDISEEPILEGVFNFDNGVLHGEYTRYSYSGGVLEKGAYLNGLRHGTITTYRSLVATKSKLHPIRRILHYNNGVIEGKDIYYYSNGIISTSRFFTDGKLNGRSDTFRTNGKLLSSCIYQNNLLSGEYITYDDIGEIYQHYYFNIFGDISVGYDSVLNVVKFQSFDYEFTVDEWHYLFTNNNNEDIEEELKKIIDDKDFFIAFYKCVSDNKLTFN